jgi:iron complex outermembrane receptor protein
MHEMKQVIVLLAFVILSWQADAQFSITGNVRDVEGNDLAGANVSIKSTFLGTSTDPKGLFRLNGLKSGEYTVIVSYVGFNAEEKKIILNGNIRLEFVLRQSALMGEEVVVSAVRASQNTPTTFSLVSGEALVRENPGKDLPYLIANEPSVTTTSDAGNGVGYTGLRVRGSDMTRINVTINGIPVNDPESQNVFWVDLPDLAGSVNNLQIQRGVGSSTNGAGAFGASINIETDALSHKPYGEISTAFGSFNTWKNSVKFGTGLLDDHWFIDGRASVISSDGYVDRAASLLKSFYLQTGYYNTKTLVKAIIFSGLENTYQAWYGVDSGTLDTARTFNWAGALFNEDGSISFYDNQVDHYQQDYYQLHFSHQLTPRLLIHLAGHYTRGKGYYEEYMQDQSFSDYGMHDLYFGRDSSITGDSVTYFFHDTINTTDLIRRRWLDNDFYGFTYSLQYNRNKIDLTLGGAVNKYDNARHYGEVIWAEFASQSGVNHIYYDNMGWKGDGNIYLKAICKPGHRLTVYGDFQYRYIHYEVSGYEPDSLLLMINETFHFINPKAGITYTLPKIGTLYASYSIANREPNRDDYVNAAAGEKPKHETLYNLEAGLRRKTTNFSFAGNIFLMNYRNQLVLTGEINEDGAYVRKNAGKSYRAGLELSGDLQMGSRLFLNGNLSLSRNKTDYNQLNIQGIMESFKNSDISFSPWLIGFMQIIFIPVNEMKIGLSGKYVSKQYLDNTQNHELSLNDYFLSDFNLGYKIHAAAIREIEMILKVNNILNNHYVSNGYVYYEQPWYYPQAGINFQAGITFRW